MGYADQSEDMPKLVEENDRLRNALRNAAIRLDGIYECAAHPADAGRRRSRGKRYRRSPSGPKSITGSVTGMVFLRAAERRGARSRRSEPWRSFGSRAALAAWRLLTSSRWKNEIPQRCFCRFRYRWRAQGQACYLRRDYVPSLFRVLYGFGDRRVKTLRRGVGIVVFSIGVGAALAYVSTITVTSVVVSSAEWALRRIFKGESVGGEEEGRGASEG